MSTIVVMPGGFHPFHAGHASLYQSALEAFPGAEVYVAATNDTKTRPFPFAIKEKLAKVAGVKPGHFVQVKSPFQAKEITQHYDPEQDVLIFVRSEKDKNEQPKPGGVKKDGTPSYFQPWTGKDLQPFGKQAYIAYLPTVEFGPGITSATEIRNAWPTLNDKRKTAMVMSLYPATQKNPKLAANVVKMLDLGMGNELDETIKRVEPISKSVPIQQTVIHPVKQDVYVAPEKKTTPAVVNHIKPREVKEFAPPSSDDGGGDNRSRRIRKLLEIAIQVAKEKNIDELGMIHGMNMIAGDEFFNTAVEGILPDITDKEYMFVLQSAYKTVKQGLAEAKKKRKKKSRNRSLGRYFFPGYGYYGGSGESGEGGGDAGGEGVAEGSDQITEYRNRLLQYVKSLLPTWPEYVLKDWLVPNKGDFSNLPPDALKNSVMEKVKGAGLTPNSKWQLVPDMKFTMDMFDPMTKQRLIGRAGGSSDMGLGVPKDKERHATQAALAQQQGGVRKEPVLLIKTAKGYELLEGWHRTIQHFHKFPDGYTGPAYVAVAQGQQGVAEGKLIESAVFLNPTTVIVGQAHGQPLELYPNTLKQIQAIAAKHGAWYEGNGTDRGYTKGQIDRYVGSWDDEVAKTASPNDPKWLYVLFANVDENNRVQRVGVDPKDTIFNRLLATAKDNSFQGIGYTPQALQKFLQMASEGQYDFVKMSQQPATQENLTRFLKAGEALMWPSNWEQYPNKAGKIAKAATVDVRDQYLATRKAGVYVTGSGHLKAVQNITGKQGVAEGFPQPGPSSGAPKQFGADSQIQTRQMTVKDIISSIPGVPYYNNVVDDWDAKDYSWGVTKKVIEYATYLKDHPESLAKLPPAIVLNGKFEDGAHRVSAIWLLQQRMDPKNPLWKNAKLNVQFVKQGMTEGGAETSWSNDTGTITLQDILELTKHIKQINLPINDNLKSKLLHWEGNPEEIERVNQVTVSNQFPILIMVDEQGQIAWILDGNHRLHKAIQSQAKTIPAKLIKPSNLNDKAKKIFNIKEQGVAEGDVVPFKQPSKTLTWDQVPRDVLLLANDWFWASEDNSGLDATIDPEGFGNGTANDVKYNAAKLQQKGWTIDFNDEYDAPRGPFNLRLTNKRGQTVLLPIEDAQDFTGWAEGTSSLNEGPFVQRITHPKKVSIYLRIGKDSRLVATDIPYEILDKYVAKVIQKYPQFKSTDFSFKETDKINEFAPPGSDDREPDEEEILRQLAAQWWNGTEQQMKKAQQTLEAMGWEIGQDESGDDDAGVFVIRAGDENGDSYIAFNHSDLSLDEGLGIPYPGTYEQDNEMTTTKGGQMRTLAIANEGNLSESLDYLEEK